MTTEISIIIPVYNVAEYVEQCLDSLYRQTFRSIEIIIVNDCSTDTSLEVINNYINQHKNNDIQTTVINLTENKGPGNARNIGIKASKSKYVCFVDPDDWVTDDYAEVLYTNIEKHKCDFVTANFYIYDNIAKTTTEYKTDKYLCKKFKTQQYTKDKNFYPSIIISSVTDKKYFLMTVFKTVWRNIYKRQFLINKNIFYLADIRYHEDCFFVFAVIMSADKFLIINKPVYYYRTNRQISATDKFAEELKNEIFIKCFCEIKNFMLSADLYNLYKDIIPFFIIKTFNILLKYKNYKSDFIGNTANVFLQTNSFLISPKYGIFQYCRSLETYLYIKIYKFFGMHCLFVVLRLRNLVI